MIVEHIANGVRFVVPGTPRTKKTSNRLVMAGDTPRVLPSKAWASWCRDVVRYVATKPALQLALASPMNCRALFYRDRDVGDAHGHHCQRQAHQGMGRVALTERC
jgi:hypothetical protein